MKTKMKMKMKIQRQYLSYPILLYSTLDGYEDEARLCDPSAPVQTYSPTAACDAIFSSARYRISIEGNAASRPPEVM
jgi:hypothetical protein